MLVFTIVCLSSLFSMLGKSKKFCFLIFLIMANIFWLRLVSSFFLSFGFVCVCVCVWCGIGDDAFKHHFDDVETNSVMMMV